MFTCIIAKSSLDRKAAFLVFVIMIVLHHRIVSVSSFTGATMHWGSLGLRGGVTAALLSHPFRRMHAQPKSGSVVDSYQTVSVNCSKCRAKLFRYKKKNGTQSNLVKLYVERISEDCLGILEAQAHKDAQDQVWQCPSCETIFARSALIHGRPALKVIGGKVRMTKR